MKALNKNQVYLRVQENDTLSFKSLEGHIIDNTRYKRLNNLTLIDFSGYENVDEWYIIKDKGGESVCQKDLDVLFKVLL